MHMAVCMFMLEERWSMQQRVISTRNGSREATEAKIHITSYSILVLVYYFSNVFPGEAVCG